MKSRMALAACLALAACAIVSCGSDGPGPSPFPPPPPPSGSNVLVGTGDIAVCGSAGTEGTAALLDRIDGTVFTAGDNAYFQGSEENYRQCYDPTWGRHKNRTRPAPGNHEYETPGASAYFSYFGTNAGPPGRGYYSFTIGNWRIVSLNSSVAASDGSPQMRWLQDDIAANPSRCLGAIWHHPVFSSGQNGSSPIMRDIWRTLRQAGAEFVIQGHDHLYERFARMDELGRPVQDGIRSFVVGTGGAPLTQPRALLPTSEARGSFHGVLKMTLLPDSFTWEFISVPPASFSDRDSGACR